MRLLKKHGHKPGFGKIDDVKSPRQPKLPDSKFTEFFATTYERLAIKSALIGQALYETFQTVTVTAWKNSLCSRYVPIYKNLFIVTTLSAIVYNNDI
jgi:hypothetical protein